MATKLFVGGLAYAVTDDELREFFETVGEVESAQVIKERETGQSKGFGFVQMKNDDDAQTAISQLDGKDLKGRSIAVNEARPMVPREPRSFGGGSGGGDRRNSGGFRGGNGGGRRY